MSDPFIVFTSANIGKTEFATFLAKAGGVLDTGYPDLGRVSQGRRHVWIFLNPERLDTLPEDVVALVTDKLGALPRGHIVLELSSEPGTEALVIDVAIMFAELWPAIFSDLEKMTLTFDDLRRVRRAGTSLHALSADAGLQAVMKARPFTS